MDSLRVSINVFGGRTHSSGHGGDGDGRSGGPGFAPEKDSTRDYSAPRILVQNHQPLTPEGAKLIEQFQEKSHADRKN